jgi:hypothetical protein
VQARVHWRPVDVLVGQVDDLACLCVVLVAVAKALPRPGTDQQTTPFVDAEISAIEQMLT